MANEDFLNGIEKEYDLIKSIGKCIAYLERDDATLGAIPFVMNRLKDKIEVSVSELNIEQDEKDKLIELFYERYELMVNKQNLLANLLDPDYRGASLSDEQIRIGLEYFNEYLRLNNIEDRISLIRSKYQQFQAGTGFFGFDSHKKVSSVSSIEWWLAFKNYNSIKDIVDLSVRILSSKPSTAKIEQILTKQKLVHSNLRNRLTNENVLKLVTIDVYNTNFNDNKKAKKSSYLKN